MAPKLINDFRTMDLCLDGFEPLLQQYSFDWVFLPKNARLSIYLRSHTTWQEIYQDEIASIFQHRANP